MSAILDAFEDLLDAQEDACGERPTATVGSVTSDAILGAGVAEQILIDGGIAESGTITFQMRVADFATPPEQLEIVTVGGRDFSLLSYTESHSVYTLTAGDPAAQETG